MSNARTKDIKVEKCGVCGRVTINDNCYNIQCPMFSVGTSRRNALRSGLSATQMFTRNLDVFRDSRRMRGGK